MFNMNEYLGFNISNKKIKSSRKRGFLQQYASEYIQPSKYLIIAQDDDNICEETDQKEETLNSATVKVVPERNYSTSDQDRIVDDCWKIIFGFCQPTEMKSMVLVCKNWYHMFLPQLKVFMEDCRVMYNENVHLEELKQYFENNGEQGVILDGLFTELATWKAHLCYDESHDIGEHWDKVYHTEIEFKGGSYRQKILPFGVPLCKGTISDQYELIASEVDTKTYRDLVEEFMGIPKSEQGPLCFHPFELSDKIQQEKEMVNAYIHEIQESLDIDTNGPIASGGEAVYTDDKYHTYLQDSSEFTFYALRSGIQRLSRRGSVKYFEPSLIEDMLYELKKVIYFVLKDAYEKKFPNKTEELKFQEPASQYNQYCIDPGDALAPTFDDSIDTDLKLNHEEILESFERVTGLKITYATVEDPYDLKDTGLMEYYAKEYGTLTVHELKEDSKEIATSNLVSDETAGIEVSPSSENDSEEDTSEEEESDEDISEEEDESIMEEEESSIQPITDDNFIDDSDLYCFDLNNLGDSLHDQLMKVSIQVHEQVYGKERAHQEKKYLKNWYGCGDYFFQNCSKDADNPPSMQFIPQHENEEVLIEEKIEDPQSEVFSEEIDQVSEVGEFGNSEKETLENACKEDLEYFGYSLYDDDFDEFPIFNEQDDSDHNLDQSSEEEALQYHLRRLLREQSYQCIVNYFSDH